MADINTPNNGPASNPPAFEKEVQAMIDTIDVGMLGIRFRNDIKDKHIDTTAFNAWLRAPWEAYDYLNGKIMPTKDNEAFLFHLQNWSHAGDGIDDPLQRQEAFKQWAEQNAEAAKLVRESIARIHNLLHEELTIQQETAKHIKIERGGNMLEDALMKTKQYIVDEFPEHPAASAGVVVAGYMLYQMVKGKRLWSMAKWGAGLGVLYSFLKDKFDFKPVEGLANVAENMGGKKVADGLRETRDTIQRAFYEPEGQKAIDEFARTEVDINDEYERYYFSALMMESPQDFLTWHNAVTSWRTSRQGPPPALPDTIKKEINDMAARGVLPSKFFDLDAKMQTEYLLTVSDKFMGRITEYAGLGSTSESLAYLNNKYVTGDFYEKMYQDWLADWKLEYPGEEGAFDRVCDETKPIIERFKKGIIVAKDEFTFLDVLRIELPQDKLQALKLFNGPGKSLSDLNEGLRYAASRAVQVTKAAGETALEYVRDIPTAARSLYNNEVQPLLESASKKLEYKDFEAAMLDLQDKLKDAIKLGKNVIDFTTNTETWKLLKEIYFSMGKTAYDAFQMTTAEALKLWERVAKLANQAIEEAKKTPEVKPDNSPDMPLPPAETPEENSPDMPLPPPSAPPQPNEDNSPDMPLPEEPDAPDMPLPPEDEHPDATAEDTLRAKP